MAMMMNQSYSMDTLTSKIKFADDIEAVRDYGFKNTLGSKLLIAPIDLHENTLPSSRQLEGLKKKGLFSSTRAGMLNSKFSMENLMKTRLLFLHKTQSCLRKVFVKGKRLPKESESDGEVSEEDEAADIEENGVKKHQKSKKNIKLSRALSECVVYAVSRHFNGFADAEARSDFHHISSLNEDKAEGLAKSKPSDFVKHNQWQLVRIYPKGSRTNSSNYDPLSNWNVGCQIVALNYQTEDEETYLNQARFRSNGEAGYVLKPPCLLEGNFDPINITKESAAVDPTSIKVTVISAQQLPKPPNNENDVIDPYVVVSVFGVDADRQSQKTSVIEDNGFNPMWMNDEPMEFNMLVPSLAFLEFKVMDKDSKGSNDLVGLYTVAVQDIAQGYRHVHLETKGIKKLTPATLFLHIEIENKLSGTGF
ncbi:1-phosphatidylinositol 4,5-bisphosphate phosphodiesterase delta-4-like [Clavelina lepadiformis]|uniref:1-phosphatidylinositol 4,5-bisphosphate phosphodiesterase delta-4-like n=1 Tax=Clavelina lepadiformis TaxID=159417 RepID=UPI0040434B63